MPPAIFPRKVAIFPRTQAIVPRHTSPETTLVFARSGYTGSRIALILEGLITTVAADGSPHLAPMGPRVGGGEFARFLLRPFPTSQTYRNLAAHPEGVLHVTDDALLLARAAVGAADPFPAVRPAERVAGFVLADCCRAFEFVARSIDDSAERVRVECEVVHTHRVRDFFGFNRAKHAVVEAAILATRFHLLPRAEVAAEFAKLRVAVDKTGGTAELEAMDFLDRHLRTAGGDR
jgi:hypothetical protein